MQRFKTALIVVQAFVIATLLMSRAPASMVHAQAVGTIRTNWASNLQQHTRNILAECASVVAADGEYTSNNYSGTLVANTDLVGSLSNLTVVQVQNAEGSVSAIAKALLNGTGLPLTVPVGTNTNLQTLAAGGTIK